MYVRVQIADVHDKYHLARMYVLVYRTYTIASRTYGIYLVGISNAHIHIRYHVRRFMYIKQ